MKKRPAAMIGTIVSVALLAMAYVLMQDWESYERVAMMLSLAFGAVVFAGFANYLHRAYEEKKVGETLSDERTEALYNSRIAKAFLLTYWVVILITWANFLMGRILGRSQLPSDISLVLVLVCMFILWMASARNTYLPR